MMILTKIDYYGEEVLTFDPEKVLKKLKNTFSQIEIDPTDYSRKQLEKIIKLATEESDEPTRSEIINQILASNRANGPSFRFKLLLNDKFKIEGGVQRYEIKFKFGQKLDPQVEKKIIDFLKSLNYGQIVSYNQTKFFNKPSEKIKGEWILDE